MKHCLYVSVTITVKFNSNQSFLSYDLPLKIFILIFRYALNN